MGAALQRLQEARLAGQSMQASGNRPPHPRRRRRAHRGKGEVRHPFGGGSKAADADAALWAKWIASFFEAAHA